MHGYVTHGECKLQVLDREIDLLKNKVYVGCACFNSLFLFFYFWHLELWSSDVSS